MKYLTREQFIQELDLNVQSIIHSPVATINQYGYMAYCRDGTRSLFEKQYFERRKQLSFSALLLTEKSDDLAVLKFLEEVIWEICNEYTWALPPHLFEQNGVKIDYDGHSRRIIDLFAAETAQSIAEISRLLKGQLSEEIVKRIEEEIEDRVFRPLCSETFVWEKMDNNWSGVIASCIGMAAIDIFGKSDKTANILGRLSGTFKSFLSGYAEDGVCLEGIGYWSYGFGYYCYFAEKYLKVFKSDYYLKSDILRNIAAFPGKIELSSHTFVPYSDVSEDGVPSGLLSFCKDYFQVDIPNIEGISDLDFDHCYRWAHLSRNLWWSKSNFTHVKNKSIFLPNAQWGIVVNDELVFSFKGGNNGEPHNHNDIGSFVLGDSNELFITDLGAGMYSKEYFDANKRYSFINTNAKGHSIPIINQQCQISGGKYHANVEKIDIDKRKFILDLTEAYPCEAKINRFIRSYFVDENNDLILIDDIDGSYSFEIEENFVSRIKPKISKENIIWRGQKNRLKMRVPPNTIPEIIEETATRHNGELENIYRLVLKTESSTVTFKFTYN